MACRRGQSGHGTEVTVAKSHILLCHRIRLFSECLARALGDVASLECTVIAADEVLARLARVDPAAPVDLLLLDPMLGGDEAPSVAELVRQRFPSCKVLLLISEMDSNRLIDFAQLGSQGCICEDVSLADLCSAIHAVL